MIWSSFWKSRTSQACVLYINIKALMFYLFSCVCNWNEIIFTIMLLHPHIIIYYQLWTYFSVRYLSQTFGGGYHMCHKITASSKCLSPFMLTIKCAQHLHSAQRSLLTASQSCQQVIHVDPSNIQKTHIHKKQYSDGKKHFRIQSLNTNKENHLCTHTVCSWALRGAWCQCWWILVLLVPDSNTPLFIQFDKELYFKQ